MSDAPKPDPFDVGALEQSVNDSATRVSTIWISFLIFGLYLLTTATTVSQKQLLLADPLKLPVLNIDLPLWGFFFLAPFLFVILHIYVLLQVLLLGRTTAAYDDALARAGLSPSENATMRQRLANTLFAQIFAGSPRERGGFIGGLLQSIVWITLAAAPVLILTAFQFSFLAYHSHIATWTHRLLILVEMAAFFVIWPLALDARKDFSWHRVRHGLARALAFPYTLAMFLLWPLVRRPWGFDWPRHQPARALPRHRLQTFAFLAYSAIALISLSLATFPGEPHVNLLTGHSPLSVQCKRWFQQKFELIDLRFDRLYLPLVDVVDDDILAKIVQHTSERGLEPSRGERTRNFRGRDFNCSDFSSGDFRRVDLFGAKMTEANLSHASFEGASLDHAELQHATLLSGKFQGASFNFAQLQGASLDLAQFQDASLDFAQLQLATFMFAQLQGVSLENAALQGASLSNAELQGAFLNNAQLQGASIHAKLQGAYMVGAQLQGASLRFAELQGASLKFALLQGASLEFAKLQGASLEEAQLQGASLNKADTNHSNFKDARVWRASGQNCMTARVSDLNQDKVIFAEGRYDEGRTKTIVATTAGISDFFDAAFAGIPNASIRNQFATQMKNHFAAHSSSNDAALAEAWRQCEAVSAKVSPEDFAVQLAEILRSIVCDSKRDAESIAKGIAATWGRSDPSDFSRRLARGMLGEDGKECTPAKDYSKKTRERLRAFAGPPPAQGSPRDGD